VTVARRDNVVHLHPPAQVKVFTPDEVARLLRVSRMTVYRLVGDGHLRAYRVGRSLRIRPDDLTAYLEAAATGRPR
jgi:excisionase family DNA binding protein